MSKELHLFHALGKLWDELGPGGLDVLIMALLILESKPQISLGFPQCSVYQSTLAQNLEVYIHV